ncbi:MAG: GAF domain-containing protein [Rhodobacteraceae bacterium]|nr:GAF domain-containing protein [Paracoccaceae bacterium]MCF8515412.1 GAF domain-containing protein [Paracoccaceae bacterium]MCF8519657.1 GAF domain-containing protein [Paracoccaceae bacterium]
MDEDPFATFAAALSAATKPEQPFEALHRLTVQTIGARLFTVTTVEDHGRLARRSYSSHPHEYPVSGTKIVEPSRWNAIVLDQRQSFVANSLAQIAEVFPDHALIGSLGLGSVINMPVILKGQICTTLNLLDVPGYYTPARVAFVTGQLTLPTMAAQLAHDALRTA